MKPYMDISWRTRLFTEMRRASSYPLPKNCLEPYNVKEIVEIFSRLKSMSLYCSMYSKREEGNFEQSTEISPDISEFSFEEGERKFTYKFPAKLEERCLIEPCLRTFSDIRMNFNGRGSLRFGPIIFDDIHYSLSDENSIENRAYYLPFYFMTPTCDLIYGISNLTDSMLEGRYVINSYELFALKRNFTVYSVEGGAGLNGYHGASFSISLSEEYYQDEDFFPEFS